MKLTLSTAYRRMNTSQLIIEATTILTCLMKHPAFAGSPPGSVPTLMALKAAIDKLHEAYEAALTHDTVKIRARKLAQDELVSILDRISKYLEMEALTNPDVMLETGFSKRRSATSSTAVPSLAHLAVYHGPDLGTAYGEVKLGALKIVEIQVAEGDPLLEKNWYHKMLSVGTAQMHMTGFNSGGQYFFRGRWITNAGLGGWSPYVSLIIR
jgi:hypothetical protein